MDRHDLEGATAADVASAHMRDVESQQRHGVRFLSYWFDDDRNSAFCLVEAPDAEAAAACHREAHGSVPNEIIPVEPEAVEALPGPHGRPACDGAPGRQRIPDHPLHRSGGIDGPRPASRRRRCDGAPAPPRRHHPEAVSAQHRGLEVKHTGDGIMASFVSVQDALRAAVQIQRGFARHNASRPEARLAVRIGMSAGEPVAESGDLFGAAVQLAARLCAYATPQTIVASGVVADLAVGKGFVFGPRHDVELRGFPYPLHRARWTGHRDDRRRRAAAPRPRSADDRGRR